MSKEQDSDNKKVTLTDAELQQVTGGETLLSKAVRDCQEQSDKANCEKLSYCRWYEGKDGYYCAWV